MGIEKTFEPTMDKEKVERMVKGWHKAVKCAIFYSEE